jgi:hypothetical protein
MSWFSRVARWIEGFNRLVCKHPQGIVCKHRQWQYDIKGKGWLAGDLNGRAAIESKWLGSVTGVGPYANYPAPTAESRAALRRVKDEVRA